MTEVEHLNRWLMDFQLTRDNKPLYRIVWSDEEIELRHGTYNEFYGDVFLRSVTETRQTPKYSYLSERWVLEKWYPPELVANSELPDSVGGSYEPFYVFEGHQGQYLPPTRKVVEFIVNRDRQGFNKVSPAERKEYYDEVAKKARAADIDSLGDSTSLVSLLHSKEAITVPDLSAINRVAKTRSKDANTSSD